VRPRTSPPSAARAGDARTARSWAILQAASRGATAQARRPACGPSFRPRPSGSPSRRRRRKSSPVPLRTPSAAAARPNPIPNASATASQARGVRYRAFRSRPIQGDRIIHLRSVGPQVSCQGERSEPLENRHRLLSPERAKVLGFKRKSDSAIALPPVRSPDRSPTSVPNVVAWSNRNLPQASRPRGRVCTCGRFSRCAT
jgi:hypothetical protein